MIYALLAFLYSAALGAKSAAIGSWVDTTVCVVLMVASVVVGVLVGGVA